MLQAIHTKERARQASSLYCQWIRVDLPEGPQLVSIWIDSEMRAFTGGQHNETQLELQPEGAEEKSGLPPAGSWCMQVTLSKAWGSSR